MLDYAVEVEHYDRHLGRILDTLDQSGLAENTIVVATSDHGMPFPRCKGQAYDYSNHVPLAIRWPAGISGNRRKVDDHVSFADFAPTFLEAARVDRRNTPMQPFAGRSLFDLFESPKSGQINPTRDFQLVGKERHGVGRPYNRGYPIRGIIKREISTCVISKTRDGPSETRKPDTSTVTQAPSKPLYSISAETGKTNTGE